MQNLFLEIALSRHRRPPQLRPPHTSPVRSCGFPGGGFLAQTHDICHICLRCSRACADNAGTSPKAKTWGEHPTVRVRLTTLSCWRWPSVLVPWRFLLPTRWGRLPMRGSQSASPGLVSWADMSHPTISASLGPCAFCPTRRSAGPRPRDSTALRTVWWNAPSSASTQ